MNITEVTGGSTTSVRQFVWVSNQRAEVRDGSSNLVAQYFSRGQVNFSGSTGTSYFYTLDHLGSVREMTNSSGSIVYQQSFDPYGQPSVFVSSTSPDFGYAGYYVHQRSGLELTRTRAYSAAFGRFINRDPIEEEGGLNLYGYVTNDPINLADDSGMFAMTCIGPGCPPKGKTCGSNGNPPQKGGKGSGSSGDTGDRTIPTFRIDDPIGALPGLLKVPKKEKDKSQARIDCEKEAGETLTERQAQCWENYLSDRRRHGEAQAQANKRRCEDTAMRNYNDRMRACEDL